jgi:hypothetical protein
MEYSPDRVSERMHGGNRSVGKGHPRQHRTQQHLGTGFEIATVFADTPNIGR